jgi:hypothetical protein
LNAEMKYLIEILLPVSWSLLWLVGGGLLAASLFRLRRGEVAMVGLGLGLVLEVWLANLLAQAVPVVPAFWLSAALVLVLGLAAALLIHPRAQLHVSPSEWLLVGGLTLLFFAIGRGLGVFDDYQNLPTVSLLAAGDIPPHFALNPSLRFGYHYLLLLFSAELVRVANMFAWSALDLARGFSLALPLVLAGLWGYRITRSRVAAALTAFVLAFSGGARWLLLVLPQAWLATVSKNVTLIGSAASSAPDLARAMVSEWRIDGAGPIAFPFAFYSGINQPYIMAYTGIAGSAIMIMLLILLTVQRWRHWSAAVASVVLFASLAIANEISFLLVGLGVLVCVVACMVRAGGGGMPRDLRNLCIVMGAALLIAIGQGGMLTEIAKSALARSSAIASYFDTTPVFAWPPSIVSAHLGSLSLVNPTQLVTALLEIGPVVLVTPLVLSWGWKSLKLGKWYEAALVWTSFGAGIALVVVFSGPLFTATPRLMGGWFFVTALYAVPLLWIWLRKRSDMWTIGSAAAGLVGSLGGLVLFAVQLAAIQAPMYSTFITPMDAKMSEEYWNRLQPGSWVFDPVVFRAPTVFGRFTNSSPTWYTRTAAWQTLRDAPDASQLRAAGYEYVYFDRDYWDMLTPTEQASFLGPCVTQLAQVDGIHSAKDYSTDFRRLLDIQACQ